MHPCLCPVALLAVLVGTSVHAGFELRFDSNAQFLANTPDQTVDLYLKNLDPYDVKVRTTVIGSYVGYTREVVFPDSGATPSYRGSEGNFQKEIGLAGIQMHGTGYFWPGTFMSDVLNASAWGQNVSQVQVGGGRSSYNVLEGGSEVKLATFHIDTTGMTGNVLNISVNDQFNHLPLLFAATQVEVLGDDLVNTSHFVGNGITVTGGTYNIAHTPEPMAIGFAGLGLTAGLGWLRARKSRRRAAI